MTQWCFRGKMYLCIYEKDILFADGLPAAGGLLAKAT